ncbi:hypothetical protein ACHAPU_010862 [Fusarium lateritium]
MFAWYRNSNVCLAYLSDVPTANTNDSKLLSSQFQNSRWFTRGWTLVELLAPRRVIFYAADWSVLGRRDDSFAELISQITGIDSAYLSGQKDPRRASVSEKMSWLSNRNTRRVEDMAYCMLGLLDVKMDLVYGEGAKAMDRFQRKISKTTESDIRPFPHNTPENSRTDLRSFLPAEEGLGALGSKTKAFEDHDVDMVLIRSDPLDELWHEDKDDHMVGPHFIHIYVLDQQARSGDIFGNLLKSVVSGRVMVGGVWQEVINYMDMDLFLCRAKTFTSHDIRLQLELGGHEHSGTVKVTLLSSQHIQTRLKLGNSNYMT